MRTLRHLSMLAVMLVFAYNLWGQAGTTGTILGTVTDTAGAVVSAAPVDVTNTATGVTVTVRSTAAGDCRIARCVMRISGRGLTTARLRLR